jgi:LysR family transcriptional activator of nhaA
MSRHLNYHHLFYFWTVAQEGHVSRSARKLGVSQSALSIQIQQLEESLGHKLFDRAGRKLTVNKAGELVLGYAEIIFSAGSELLNALSSPGDSLRPIIRIGSVATLSRNFQDGMIHALLQHSDLELVLESGSIDELIDRLRAHKLHVVLSNSPVSSSAGELWRCRRISRQPVCLVGWPRKHKRAFRIHHDLNNVRLIVPGPSSAVRRDFDAFLERNKIQPKLFAQVDDAALLRLLARHTDAIAVTPEVVVKDELSNGDLEVYCKVPGVFESFYAITRDSAFESSILKAILER